jgi:hypothetical protein
MNNLKDILSADDLKKYDRNLLDEYWFLKKLYKYIQASSDKYPVVLQSTFYDLIWKNVKTVTGFKISRT